MTCPCCQSPDLESYASKIKEVEMLFGKCMTGSREDIKSLEEVIDQAINGIDQAKLEFKKKYNEEKQKYDAWSAAGKKMERLSKQARNRYFELKDRDKMSEFNIVRPS